MRPSSLLPTLPPRLDVLYSYDDSLVTDADCQALPRTLTSLGAINVVQLTDAGFQDRTAT